MKIGIKLIQANKYKHWLEITERLPEISMQYPHSLQRTPIPRLWDAPKMPVRSDLSPERTGDDLSLAVHMQFPVYVLDMLTDGLQ